MNTPKKLLIDILRTGNIQEAHIEAQLLLEHFCQASPIDLALNNPLQNLELAIQKAQERVHTKQPIQHIIGSAYFMGEKFVVNQNVLIPRDETEILVRKAIEIIQTNTKDTSFQPHSTQLVLDIGTGSGCIACIIAKKTPAQVIGVDISSQALQIALDNALALNLSNRAIFRKSDLFSNVHNDEKFDMIVSNPPYIPISQKNSLQFEVENFDPDLALFAPDELGLEFYKNIIQKSPPFLKPNAYLMFELGYAQAPFVKTMMELDFCDIEIIKDLAGIERVIYGKIKI